MQWPSTCLCWHLRQTSTKQVSSAAYRLIGKKIEQWRIQCTMNDSQGFAPSAGNYTTTQDVLDAGMEQNWVFREPGCVYEPVMANLVTRAASPPISNSSCVKATVRNPRTVGSNWSITSKQKQLGIHHKASVALSIRPMSSTSNHCKSNTWIGAGT